MLIELATCSNIVSTGENCEARTGEEEELLLNTVAACTNITFYACKVSNRTCSVVIIRNTNVIFFVLPSIIIIYRFSVSIIIMKCTFILGFCSYVSFI